MSDPRGFLREYVEPAFQHWAKNPNDKHLAVHAIAQFDVLAEVVAQAILPISPAPARREVSAFRNELGSREPVLAIIRDANDSHKHGTLLRTNAVNVSQGQRPEIVTEVAFFLDYSFLDSPGTPIETLILRLNNGTEMKIGALLLEAREAWSRELNRLGL
jgi:hypothetical protein